MLSKLSFPREVKAKTDEVTSLKRDELFRL